MAEAEGEGHLEPPEDREANLKKIQEQLDYLMTKENLQEDSFIQMNMDAQMNIPICILAGHEKFEEMGKVVDVSSLYDAALQSQNVVVDKVAMQVKPIIKSKRNTVILHDLPDQIPVEVSKCRRGWEYVIEGLTLSKELQELFRTCPTSDKLKSIKPDVNSTAFVTFEDDGAAQDAALWLRSQKLRGASVKCSMKSEQFLRSFFPMKPVANLQSYGVPAWAAAWTGQWASWGKDGSEKGWSKGGEAVGPTPHGPPTKGKGKGWGKGGPKGPKGGEMIPPAALEGAFPGEANEQVELEDNSGYRHEFRRYTRQQIMEICGKMELVEKPDSYKKMEANSDLALFSQQPNKDWAPLPTPLGSFMGSESRRTDESDTAEDESSRKHAHRKESRQTEAQVDWENWENWENWKDPNAWTENWGSKSGRSMQWVAKTKPGAEAQASSKPSWAEKVKGGGTKQWQAKPKPETGGEDAQDAPPRSESPKEGGEGRPSWADKVRQSLDK